MMSKVKKRLTLYMLCYFKYETGENDIPTTILIKLSKFYDTGIDYLLEQTNEKKISLLIKKENSNRHF